MAKRIVFTVVEFALFLALFYVGALWDAYHLGLTLRFGPQNPLVKLLPTVVHRTPAYDYVLNGLVFAAVLLLLIWVGQLIRKTLRRNGALTALAFLLALVIDLFLHWGRVQNS